MLTTTETIEKPISPTEKIALDNQKVCEAFIKYYEAGDRQNALEYAKVIFLKAMSLWVFHNLWKLWKLWKTQILKILIFKVFEFFRNLII